MSGSCFTFLFDIVESINWCLSRSTDHTRVLFSFVSSHCKATGYMSKLRMVYMISMYYLRKGNCREEVHFDISIFSSNVSFNEI